MQLRSTILALAAGAAGLGLAACGSSTASPSTTQPTTTRPAAATTTTTPRSVFTAMAADPDLRVMTAAVEAGGQVDLLIGPGPFTVFAPTNAAIKALPHDTLVTLLNTRDRASISRFVQGTVVPGPPAAELAPGTLTTALGGTLTVSTEGGATVVTDAKGDRATVTGPGTRTGNGVLYVVDGVLQPGP